MGFLVCVVLAAAPSSVHPDPRPVHPGVDPGSTSVVGSSRLQAAPPLPDSVPLFPLPDITLFPGVPQPLHIFEPRYREMVAAALAGDSVIAMVMLRPGWEGNYEGNPPVHELGGVGIIESVQRLSDGRYNLVLRGTAKIRIQGEETSRPYRVARVEPVPERLSDEERVRLSRIRADLEDRVRERLPELEIPSDLSDEVFVNTLCQFLPMEPADRQDLLRADDALARVEALMGFLGMTRQALRTTPIPGD